MRFRLIEPLLNYDEEYTAVKQLIADAVDLIEETEGDCILRVLQWDPKYDTWIGITEATEALSGQIESIRRKYLKTIEGVEKIGKEDQ